MTITWELIAFYTLDETRLRKGCPPGDRAITVELRSESAVVAEVGATLRRKDIDRFTITKKVN